MFVLRRITSEGNEVNECLGKAYNFIHEENHEAEYKRAFDAYFKGLKKNDTDIYGFIIYENGGQAMPLYRKSTYFVMTESGQTFANITYKN